MDKKEKKENKKTFRYLYTAFSMFCAIVMLSLATIAWFSNNKKVDSNGMQMQVTAPTSLIVSDTLEDLQAATDANLESRTATTTNTSTNYFAVSWAAQTNKLKCATHDWSVGTTNGLKYNTNDTAVSRSTGLASGSTALTFADAKNDEDHVYFVDYVVYVASMNDKMDGKLNVALVSTGTVANDYKASSIDFYVGDTVSASTYKGTLNLAGYSYTNSGAAFTTVELADSVPAVTGTPLKVTMRCYFDGGLIDRAATTKTYIRSKDLSTTTNFSFDVNFTLEETE